jgi:hypothetical protein
MLAVYQEGVGRVGSVYVALLPLQNHGRTRVYVCLGSSPPSFMQGKRVQRLRAPPAADRGCGLVPA